MKMLDDLLAGKEIKPTAMRLLVLKHLLQQSAAISLTELELGMGKTDRVTLYRTIRTFEEHGLVHRIEDGSNVTKFALCEENCNSMGHHDLHVHFFCTRCKETHCLPKTHVPEVILPPQYQGNQRELTIKGLCGRCNA